MKAFISSNKNLSDYTAQRTLEVLDLCLECKSCKTECPSNVDMTKLKYEFLQAYYKENKIKDVKTKIYVEYNTDAMERVPP